MPRPSRTQRAAAWAYRARRKLIEEMGGCCARCRVTEDQSEYALEFDHPNGRDWSPRKTSRWMRVIRYRRDWLAGNLQLSCKECNARDGARRRWGRKERP